MRKLIKIQIVFGLFSLIYYTIRAILEFEYFLISDFLPALIICFLFTPNTKDRFENDSIKIQKSLILSM